MISIWNKTTVNLATTNNIFNVPAKSYNLITNLLANKYPKQFKVNFSNMSSYSTLSKILLMNVLPE